MFPTYIVTDLTQINNDNFAETVMKGDYACKLESCVAVTFCVVAVSHTFYLRPGKPLNVTTKTIAIKYCSTFLPVSVAPVKRCLKHADILTIGSMKVWPF